MDIPIFLKEKVPLFKALTDPEAADLVNESQVRSFEAREAVIEFGEEGLFVGVLLEGEAEVSVYLDTGQKKKKQTQ